jgi:hypothetical protein
MGPAWWKCLPYFAAARYSAFYLFDAWSDTHAQIHEFTEHFGVQHAFLSASQAVDALARCGSSATEYYWIPEGITPEAYRYYDYGRRDIDVLQLGRRHDVHHRMIVEALARDGYRYLHETEKGAVIFPDRSGFIDGLARSRISICVPSSITHPDRSGSIETLTIRYLQSMVAKCLILGHAPRELVSLFGYNPVIEIDSADPVEQVRDLLRNFDDYLPLIERNHRTVVANHTWMHRWDAMAAILFDE